MICEFKQKDRIRWIMPTTTEWQIPCNNNYRAWTDNNNNRILTVERVGPSAICPWTRRREACRPSSPILPSSNSNSSNIPVNRPSTTWWWWTPMPTTTFTVTPTTLPRPNKRRQRQLPHPCLLTFPFSGWAATTAAATTIDRAQSHPEDDGRRWRRCHRGRSDDDDVRHDGKSSREPFIQRKRFDIQEIRPLMKTFSNNNLFAQQQQPTLP